MISNRSAYRCTPFDGLLLSACLAVLLFCATSLADTSRPTDETVLQANSPPSGKPVTKSGVSVATNTVTSSSAELRIEGKISVDGKQKVIMDLAALQALGLYRIATSTVVTDGVLEFDGVLMRDVFEYVGARGKRVTATALNGYEIEIPMQDFVEFDVVLAWAVDGRPLRADDKGPFWIVYPRDQHQVLQDIRYDYRWVWQLSSLRVH